MSKGRAAPAQAVFRDRLYAIGGADSDGSVEVFDVAVLSKLAGFIFHDTSMFMISACIR